MSKIANRDYAALNLSGDNYLQWALDTRISLKSKGLGDTITEDNNENEKNRYRAIGLMCHHLIEGLKNQYMTIENPLDLWNALKHRYDHQKMVLLPKARHDWMHLRFLDYKSVDEYNSALFKIVSILRLCGEEVSDMMMLEKTYTTFNQSNSVLQEQYRTKGFATYTDLISCLLLAEAKNELLMKNSGARPAGTAPLPEAHEVEKKDPKETYFAQDNRKPYGNGRGGYKRRGRDNHNARDNYSTGRKGNHNNRGRVSDYGRGRGSYGRGRGGISKPSYTSKSVCHRCGMDNHWAKNCRTMKHLCDLYQESLKNKNPEANMIQENGHDDKGYGYDADNESDKDNKDDLMDFETSDCLKD
ncbi:uncharacterized protein LOC117131437 [Brassica rapa]|uniref:uncharacterized protein LOC117131437 n=1 Tax=Brassica campestris TaxID=3711 RepID=UPI00142D7A28|nr:uncharacterized protein LOC117131437 [Brassica rapa]